MNDDHTHDRTQQLAASYRESGELLVLKTRPGLLALARRRGLDPSAARDVVQQAFHALFERRPRLANVEAWLVRVVLRRCADWFRREAAQRELRCPASLPDEPIDRLSEDQRLAVRSVVERLPERQRLLVIARYFDGHSESEAAEVAGYSPSSYKQTMTRALAAMKRELERGCGEAKRRDSGAGTSPSRPR